MGLIEVNGIRVFAFHGCLEEEARIGSRYRVDVHVQGDLDTAEANDTLADTIDYGRITELVKACMAERSRLIEHVCRRILEALRQEWPGSYTWKVRVEKEAPPVNGDVDHVAYTLEG